MPIISFYALMFKQCDDYPVNPLNVIGLYIQVTKKFAKRKQAHVGMKSSKTNQTRRERHHNTFTPSLHLVPFCQNCVFVFVF